MSDVFVVIAYWGESEDYTEEIRGAFSTEALARSSLARMPRIADQSWQDYQAWDSRRNAYLEGCEPRLVMPASKFMAEFKGYHDADYKAAKLHAGSEPKFWVSGVDGYRIEALTIDAIDPALVRIVEDIRQDAKAAPDTQSQLPAQ